MRTLVFALFCLAPLAHSTPLPKDYVASLARVYEGIRVVEDTAGVCRTLHPTLARPNEVAWRQWQLRHTLLLAEYEGRYRGYIRNLAGKNDKQYATYLKIMKGKFQEKKTVLQATYKNMDVAKSRQLCQSFPALLENKLNPEKTLRADIDLTRRLLPVY